MIKQEKYYCAISENMRTFKTPFLLKAKVLRSAKIEALTFLENKDGMVEIGTALSEKGSITDRVCYRCLRKQRIACNVSIKDFAEGLGLSGWQLRKYESGTNSVKLFRLYEMADYLKINITELLPRGDKL